MPTVEFSGFGAFANVSRSRRREGDVLADAAVGAIICSLLNGVSFDMYGPDAAGALSGRGVVSAVRSFKTIGA